MSAALPGDPEICGDAGTPGEPNDGPDRGVRANNGEAEASEAAFPLPGDRRGVVASSPAAWGGAAPGLRGVRGDSGDNRGERER